MNVQVPIDPRARWEGLRDAFHELRELCVEILQSDPMDPLVAINVMSLYTWIHGMEDIDNLAPIDFVNPGPGVNMHRLAHSPYRQVAWHLCTRVLQAWESWNYVHDRIALLDALDQGPN